MRKLLSILSVTGLLLAFGAAQAQAECYTFPAVAPIKGYTVGGTLCYGQNSASLNGTATKNGQTYDIVAWANVTGSGANMVLSGSVTVTLNGNIVKQVTIHEGIPSRDLAAIEAFLSKLRAPLP